MYDCQERVYVMCLRHQSLRLAWWCLLLRYHHHYHAAHLRLPEQQ
jgi:hypothetical protein